MRSTNLSGARLLPPKDMARCLQGPDTRQCRGPARRPRSRHAVRCAFWLVIHHAFRGDMGGATGWLGRAQRLQEGASPDCVERGYLLLPAVIHQRLAGEYEAGYVTAAEAAGIGARFRDADLCALAIHEQGRMRIKQGAVEAGLGLLDEAMVAVTAGTLSPIVTGLTYCSVIDQCREVYALGRAQEWTVALTRWCAEQPDMVRFTGECLAHRAEIMVLHGGWRDALDEARRACASFSRASDHAAAAAGYYQQGEVHRLRGDLDLAEGAYPGASQWGWQPQPGLALLRMAQGRPDTAAGAIARVLGETTERLQRARLLPAAVEIMLSVGDVPQARAAGTELAEIAASIGLGVLAAMAGQATGAVQLAEGDARAALISLRRACRLWQDVQAPYQVACVRVLMGLACRELGDDDAATWELDAARSGFEELGAAPDATRVDSLLPGTAQRNPGALTDREVQVLRLVAAGLWADHRHASAWIGRQGHPAPRRARSERWLARQRGVGIRRGRDQIPQEAVRAGHEGRRGGRSVPQPQAWTTSRVGGGLLCAVNPMWLM